MSDAGGARAGTATVVFTDLVDSTALRQSLGDDEADELRREHDRLVRDAVAAHDGTEVKALGDGFMVVFPAAAQAISAAVAAQQGVDRFARRSGVAMRIRVGVSAGDVVWEDDDCFGTPVVEASRLCAEAGAGRILVSDVVRLLAGSRGAHQFTPVGSLELKGLSEPLAASEVVWAPVGDDRIVELPSALTPTDRLDYVGRTDERDLLVDTWKDTAAGNRRVALISGEPGVGKTRLSAELAHLAHEEGATVLFGRCDEDLGVPYQPFVEAFRPYVTRCPAELLAEQVAPYGGDLARLVPELASRLPDLPEQLHADPETERYRLFDAVTSFLAGMARETPVVIVLDDLHWAAKPTLLLLRHVMRTEWSGPLLIVGTYRDTDLGRTHPLADMLADLRREGGVERIALHGLAADEVADFVAAVAGHDLDREGAALARRIHAETEGNPFFMSQVLQHLIESRAIVQRDGRWVRGEGASTAGIPEGVREVVGRRLARLRSDTNEILAAAAVVGRDFDHDLLTAASGADTDAVFDALDEAEQARLVAVGDDRPGRYTFVHALVRSTLYEEIPTTRRLRLHRRVGEALEARGVDTHLDQLAHHFAEAAALGVGDKAVDYGRRAARRALDRLAYEEAAADYERALSGIDPDSADAREQRAELLVELGTAVQVAGERGRARELFLEAIGLARAAGRPDLVAEGALGIGGIRGWSEAGRVDDELVALLEEALTALPPGDGSLRALVTARLGSEIYFYTHERDRRMRLTNEALDMARRLDDPETFAHVLMTVHWGLSTPFNAHERLELARQMLEISRSFDNRVLESSALGWLVIDLVQIGDMAGANAAVTTAAEVADALRRPELRWAAGVQQGALALGEGRLDDAEQIIEQALAHGEQAEIETRLQMYGVAMYPLRRYRGGLEEMEPVVKSLVDEYPLLPAWRTGLAFLYREMGRLDDAREQYEWFTAEAFENVPEDGNWPVAMAILSLVCSSLGDTAHAPLLYEKFLPYADFVVAAGMPADILGSAHLFLALVAATAGRRDDFEHHAAEALARNEAMGLRTWLATAQSEIARVLFARDEPGDADRAAALVTACLAVCDELGMPSLAGRAQALTGG